MNDSGSRDLRPHDAMNNSILWMTRTTLDHKPKSVDAMYSSGLWIICTILGREHKVINVINSSSVCML